MCFPRRVCIAVHHCFAGATRVTAHETEAAKIRFCKNAIAGEYDFARPAVISEQAVSAIEWSLKKTACQAACAREKIICQIEQIVHRMWSSGEAQQWLEGCADEAVKRIAAHVNGPLLMRLAKLIGYHDTACVDLLRHGEHVHHCFLSSCFAFVYSIFRRPAARNSTLQQQRHPYRSAPGLKRSRLSSHQWIRLQTIKQFWSDRPRTNTQTSSTKCALQTWLVVACAAFGC